MTVRAEQPVGSPEIKLQKVGIFVTARSYRLAGRRILWQARQHRKGLDRLARALEELPVPIWQTARYNAVMGIIFAIGSALFMLGSVLSMLPVSLAPPASVANIVFFVGSIPFTLAAYLQHFQAANASPFVIDPAGQVAQPIAWLGWKPRDLGWLSTLAQLLGTLAFNINTLNAVLVTGVWYVQDLLIWVPDMVGSALFLISAYLAFMETCKALWCWQPRHLAWQIVFINLVGCVAFMISAFLAYTPKSAVPEWVLFTGNWQLFAGATCFFVAALLSVVESRQAA